MMKNFQIFFFTCMDLWARSRLSFRAQTISGFLHQGEFLLRTICQETDYLEYLPSTGQYLTFGLYLFTSAKAWQNHLSLLRTSDGMV